MSGANSTPIDSANKPKKPYPDFPLFPHASGRWAKKIGGKLRYFGKWDDPQKALENFLAEFPKTPLNRKAKSRAVVESPELPKAEPVSESVSEPVSEPASEPTSKPARESSKTAVAKPYADFPMYAHPTGRWCKRIRGKLHYFGPVADWKAALDRYNYEIPFLSQGVIPPPRDCDLLHTVWEVCNLHLANCEERVKTGELSNRSFHDYKRVSRLLIDHFGGDYPVEHITKEQLSSLREALARKYCLESLGNEIARCRVIFNYAYKDGLIESPVRYGKSFSRPSVKALRIAKSHKPAKVFTIDELKAIYSVATPIMRCFMLLALNGGMGGGDIGLMRHRHISNGWVDFPRPKTGVARRFPLWAESKEAIAKHCTDGKGDDLVFTTRTGSCWYKGDDGSSDCPVSKEFRKFCLEAKCHQQGRGFYALRHQFRTVADSSRDSVAIDVIMGHADSSMGAAYREWVEPARLQAVVDHVYAWVSPMWK